MTDNKNAQNTQNTPDPEQIPEKSASQTPDPKQMLNNSLPGSYFKYVFPVFTLLAGTAMLLGAAYFTKVISLIVSGLFVISGILMLFGLRGAESRGKNREQLFNFNLYLGAWFVILGIASLAKSDIIVLLIPVFFGSALCLFGVVKLRLVFSSKGFRFLFAASAYVSAAAGILVIICPTSETMKIVFLIGVMFVAEGVLDALLFIINDFKLDLIGKIRFGSPKTAVIVRICVSAAIVLILAALTYFAYDRIPEYVSGKTLEEGIHSVLNT